MNLFFGSGKQFIIATKTFAHVEELKEIITYYLHLRHVILFIFFMYFGRFVSNLGCEGHRRHYHSISSKCIYESLTKYNSNNN